MKTKLFALFFALVLIVGTMFAEIYSGSCGENLTWSLNTEDSTLTIEGTGAMYSWSYNSSRPWEDYCSMIKYLSLPGGLTTIGDYAFNECTNLTSVIIPEGVTGIGVWAFNGCQLASITIPASLSYIGFAAISPVSSVYISDISAWCRMSFNTNGGTPLGSNSTLYLNGQEVIDLVIPNDVTSIGKCAFHSYKKLRSVTIPNSVTKIGSSAFGGCSNLEAVYINDLSAWCNITFEFTDEPNYYADGSVNPLYNAHHLYLNNDEITNLVIPEGVTTIKSFAFAGATSFTSVTIPSTVSNIGKYAFRYCAGLRSVYNYARQPQDIDTNAFQYIDYDSCVLYVLPTLKDEYINWGGFSNVQLINPIYGACGENLNWILNIEDSTLTITGDGIMESTPWSPYDSYVKYVSLPDGLNNIAGSAFYGCSGLTSVEIPNSVTSIGSYAFSYCSALTSIEIPNSVTSIGNWAFNGCSGLASITIPNSVTTIGNKILYGCTNITTVVAPAQIFEAEESSWAYYTKQLDSVVINRGELTDNVLSVVKRSYKTLKTLDVSATTNTTLPDEAFKDCYNLQTLVLPANLENISYMAVAGCKNLKAIDIPASVEEIEQSAFEDCRSIETITFGGVQPSSAPGRHNAPMASASQLERIGNWAFYNCHELQNLEIPEGVTEIGDGAFYGCVYLENLTLPSSVQAIGDNCFALCAKLEKIVVNAPVPPTIQAKTFYEVSRTAPVYVPDESLEAYFHHPIWSELNIVGKSQAPSSISNIQSDNVQTTKILHNGQILILRGDKVYTLQGAEVK